jgi:UDP-N-acetylglucosamine 1-carboxyvinyltransferase
MEKFVIHGGAPLSGTVVPAGNKNGALAILAASVLTDAELVLGNVPRIRDVDAMLEILAGLGVRVQWRGDHELTLCGADADARAIEPALGEQIRACWRASAAPRCPRPAATSSAAGDWIRTSTDSRRSAPSASTTAASCCTPSTGCAPATCSWTSRR